MLHWDVKSSQFRSIVYLVSVCPACLCSKGSASASLGSGTWGELCPHHKMQHLRHQLQLLRQTYCFLNKSPGKEEGGLLRDLSHGLSVCSGPSNAAERRNLPWQFPYPRKYWACSGHRVGEGPMLFQLVLQASLGCGRKAAFSVMKEVFLKGNHLPCKVCSFAFVFPFPTRNAP